MTPLQIKKFLGIAPRYSPDLEPGCAYTAKNCELSSGKIKPILAAGLKQANTTKWDSLFFHNEKWYVGNGRFYCPWRIGAVDILFYLSGGVLKKDIGGDEFAVGQDPPAAPTITVYDGAGSLSGTFTYFITQTRKTLGYSDESGPSTLTTAVTAASAQIKVTAPTFGSDIYSWSIYRMSEDTGDFQFVTTVLCPNSYYMDETADADLDTAPTTFYTSDQGNDIEWAKPIFYLDGLCREPYAGMLFAWAGSTLYWSEPGYPDAWPSHYSMNFPSKIKAVLPFGGALAVLTENGPFRVDGTHPELLQQSKALGEHPCTSFAACKAQSGVLYLSDAGLVLFNLTTTTVVSDSAFTEAWFKENRIPYAAQIIEHDSKIMIAHSQGTLIADMRSSPPIWTTSDVIPFAFYRDPTSGDLYYLDATGIQKYEDGSSYQSWEWESGNLYGTGNFDKGFSSVEIQGKGTVTLALKVGILQVASKALDFTTLRGRVLGFPSGSRGRTARINLSGTGEVYSATIFMEEGI